MKRNLSELSSINDNLVFLGKKGVSLRILNIIFWRKKKSYDEPSITILEMYKNVEVLIYNIWEKVFAYIVEHLIHKCVYSYPRKELEK